MLKYITKRFIFYTVIFIAFTFILFNFLGILHDHMIFNVSHFAPVESRIAVYHPDKGGILRQLVYLRPVPTSDYLYANIFGGDAHMVVRYGLKFDYYTFSHFKIITPFYPNDSSVYGYDPALYDYSPYTYNEVLKEIYGVHNSGSIKSITVVPGNDTSYNDSVTLSFTDYNPFIIKDRESIDKFYDILSDVIFESYDSSPSENSTALSIELKSGEVIDNIIFGVERFFIRSGPVSAPLSKDDIDTLNEILKIRR